MESRGYVQAIVWDRGAGFTRLAERNVGFPSTPGIDGTGVVLIASRGFPALPSGMGKTRMFVDVTMMI